ncbi:GDYXXLXY domain-containing protein [Polluticoccus soli]|uniref:GDYXXLXY domain-containing protein n=1 Tax=Polluticoccus soli TaxID=3034150 RepID=UPI0023E1FA49|nr:GDYXXLXY domain-containing protein [Flavipsychrobacter sp. JY13-12]
MSKLKKILLIVNLALIVVLFNFSVYKKEQTLHNGTLVLMPLAPVDPRSLMQGDYMRLNYNYGEVNSGELAKRGYCVVKLNDSNVATVVRFQPSMKPLATNERLVKYFVGSAGVRIGAESYFFEEGTADKYAEAKYGALRVDDKGNSVLHGLYDENKRLIK